MNSVRQHHKRSQTMFLLDMEYAWLYCMSLAWSRTHSKWRMWDQNNKAAQHDTISRSDVYFKSHLSLNIVLAHHKTEEMSECHTRLVKRLQSNFFQHVEQQLLWQMKPEIVWRGRYNEQIRSMARSRLLGSYSKDLPDWSWCQTTSREDPRLWAGRRC